MSLTDKQAIGLMLVMVCVASFIGNITAMAMVTMMKAVLSALA